MARGHVTKMLEIITYSSVVTSEAVQNALTTALLHDLEVKAADVFAYVQKDMDCIWFRIWGLHWKECHYIQSSIWAEYTVHAGVRV